MSLETIENYITLLAVIIALLGCLFKYIDVPRRGYLFLCIHFLSFLLSEYYWAVYTLVMHKNPDVSANIAYLGWNIGYVFLLICVIYTADKRARRSFHPLMLIPIPLGIAQFLLYIQYGGIINNTIACSVNTAVACVCVQSIMYYRRNRSEGAHFPHFHLIVLWYIAVEFGMWTSSCFAWPGEFQNPYYYLELAYYAFAIGLAPALSKDYEAEGLESPEKRSEDYKFQVRIQALVCFILLGMCAGGYYMALSVKNALPANSSNTGVYNIIAMMLFGLSLFLELIILAILYVVALRYKSTRELKEKSVSVRRNRFNLLLTLAITLGLMIFSVIYNSRLYYDISVNRIYDMGEDKAGATANELDNYLTLAESTLKVTADTVELMERGGESVTKIHDYLTKETTNQKREFDENFTGIYAYIDGNYLDGSGWIPPEGYDPTQRDWYKAAVDARGDVVIVSPYLDAQTGDVVITIAKLLSTPAERGIFDVVALDVIVNHVQEVAQSVNLGGKGYAVIINSDGMIVAHHDREHNGKNIRELLGDDVFYSITGKGSGTVHASLNDDEHTLFISRVMDQWYVVIVVTRGELLEEVRSQLAVNIAVSLVIFALISLFYYLGYKNEQAYGKKMEEMKIGRQKQEYEAEVLRLEKVSADEANKAKSDFLADMSHEIRTPINAILGMNEMILRETNEKATLEYSQNIKSSGRNLLELVNSILDFSKIEDGKMEIIPVVYSLSTLITYLINSVSERANAKNLKLETNIDPTLPAQLYGDDARIEQVILNLLTNAVKYTHEGSVTLTIKGLERETDRIKLYVEVKDTGIGIKESDMGRLFESFERLEEVRNRNIEGTGLGISIITKLLALMDSELKVESRYGEGSVFYFTLWQKTEGKELIGQYHISTTGADELHSYHESFHAPDAHILIVDDTPMNIMVAVNLLKETKMKTDTAQSGSEAVELAKTRTYDVILLDQRMPGMDGTQTLHAIRELTDGLNADTPVICLTADAIRGAKEKYIALGFSDYLTKPVAGRDLERMLIKYLPKDKVTAITPSAAPGDTGPTPVDITALADAGFDTSEGMRYSGGEVSMYRSILVQFAREYDKKSVKLSEDYEEGLWDDYSILIHSVKSSARMIGEANLSEEAAKLESACENGDITYVKKNHDDTMKLYEKASRLIKDNIEGAKDTEEDSGDILEFEPEYPSSTKNSQWSKP